MCGTTHGLQKHHVMNASNRKHADSDGLWVWLCMEHHTGSEGVHTHPKLMTELKRQAQAIYEDTHTREEWMKKYGRNYRE